MEIINVYNYSMYATEGKVVDSRETGDGVAKDNLLWFGAAGYSRPKAKVDEFIAYLKNSRTAFCGMALAPNGMALQDYPFAYHDGNVKIVHGLWGIKDCPVDTRVDLFREAMESFYVDMVLLPQFPERTAFIFQMALTKIPKKRIICLEVNAKYAAGEIMALRRTGLVSHIVTDLPYRAACSNVVLDSLKGASVPLLEDIAERDVSFIIHEYNRACVRSWAEGEWFMKFDEFLKGDEGDGKLSWI